MNYCSLKGTNACLTCTHIDCADYRKKVEAEITKKITEKYDNGILIERIVEYL